jgi:hypothetical protein
VDARAPRALGAEGTDHDPFGDGVRAEHVVRIRVPPRGDQLDLVLARHARVRCFSWLLGAIDAASRAWPVSADWDR